MTSFEASNIVNGIVVDYHDCNEDGLEGLVMAIGMAMVAMLPMVTYYTLCHMVAMRNYHDDGSAHTSYLSFFLHWQNFWRIKFTPKNANFSR